MVCNNRFSIPYVQRHFHTPSSVSMTTSHDFSQYIFYPKSCSYEIQTVVYAQQTVNRQHRHSTLQNVYSATPTTSDFTAYQQPKYIKTSLNYCKTIHITWFKNSTFPSKQGVFFLICQKANDTFIHYCFVEAMTLSPSAQWKCFIFKIPLEAVGGGNCPQVCMHIKW